MSTRDLILKKTFGLLLEKGYDGVSVSDIQETTGMARGLLYHYFGNQHRLYMEAVGSFFDDWVKWNKTEMKGLNIPGLIVQVADEYNRVGQEMVVYFGERVAFSAIKLLFLEACRHHRDFAELYQSALKESLAVWKRALLNSFTCGELRNGLNIDSVARHFVYICEGGIWINQGIDSPTKVIYNLEKSLTEFYEIIRR